MLIGVIGLAIIFWLAGYYSHIDEKPKHVIPTSRVLKVLFVINRNDKKMSTRGIAFQLSAYIFTLFGVLDYLVFSDAEVRKLLIVGCFSFLIIGQFIWIFVIAPYWFRR